jgi:bisphosphoglycerate-dependent phosphoglycerate mutase
MWYSTKGWSELDSIYSKFLSELKNTNEIIKKNLIEMEKKELKKYSKLQGLSYQEKINKFNFERLERIQNELKIKNNFTANIPSIAHWCFENIDATDIQIKNEAFYYNELYILAI